MWRIHGGHGGHQVWAGVHHVTHGDAALAVAHQVELADFAGGAGADVVQLGDQRFAALGRAVEGVDLRHKHSGALALQGCGDFVPVVDAGDAVEGKDAGH